MQYNIFQNDFFEEMPGLPWAYRIDVLVGDPPRAIAKLTKSIKEIDIPDAELETFDVFHNGWIFKIPTRYKNSNFFTATFNEDKNLSVYREILKLFRHSYDNREQNITSFRGTDYVRKYANNKEEIILVVYLIDVRKINYQDTQLETKRNAAAEEIISRLTVNDPEVVCAYTFRDCFVENIDSIELDYSSEECVEWPIRIHFNEMSVEYPHRDKIVVGLSEDEFQMEDLAISDRKEEPEKYYARANKKVETETIGKAKEVTYQQAKAYLEHEQKLIENKQKSERETAAEIFSKNANDAGMDVHGNYRGFLEREAAMTEVSDQAVANTLASYSYDALRESKVDLLADTDTEVARQASEADKQRAASQSGGYGIGDWQIVPNAVQASRNLKEDLEKIPTEVDIAFRDAGVVELPQSNETAQYYGENRNTLSKNSSDQAVVGALIAQSKTEREAAEAERQYWINEYAKERTLYQKGHRKYETWLENFDVYYAHIKESEARISEAKSSYDKIKSENPSVAREINRH